MGERKFVQLVLVSWPRWPPCPYMIKALKNLLRNQKADDLEIWYAASGPQVWPWPIQGYSMGRPSIYKNFLTYFMARSDLVPYAFVWEKIKTMDFSETIVVYDIKVGRCSQLGEYVKFYEYQRSRSFTDLRPDHSDSIFLNYFSSITADFNVFQHSGERYRTSGPLVSLFSSPEPKAHWWAYR